MSLASFTFFAVFSCLRVAKYKGEKNFLFLKNSVLTLPQINPELSEFGVKDLKSSFMHRWIIQKKIYLTLFVREKMWFFKLSFWKFIICSTSFQVILKNITVFWFVQCLSIILSGPYMKFLKYYKNIAIVKPRVILIFLS